MTGKEGGEYYPAPGIDPKRPYGAMTYYYADMTNASGMKYETDQEGHAVFAPEQEEIFHKLYEDMQRALQVFLRYAMIPPELFPDEKQISRQLEGKIFVLTGALETMTRNEAKALIEQAGGKVTDSVSKKTTFLVVGADPGSKLDKAKKSGIATIDENALKELTD